MPGFDLRESPFYVLSVSPRAGRIAISEALEAALDAGDIDEATGTRAQQSLMAAKPRLLAEMSWLLGVAPNRARALIDLQTPTTEPLSSLPLLAATNLAAHWCTVSPPDYSIIAFLVRQQGAIDPVSTTAAVNSERTVSRFGPVDGAFVSETLNALRTRHVEAAHCALTRMDHPGTACLRLVKEVQDASPVVSGFVEELVGRFDAWANPELRRRRDDVFQLLTAMSEQGTASASDCATLATLLSAFQTLVCPMQFSSAHHGLVDARTKEMFERLRATTIQLNNEATDPHSALSLLKCGADFFRDIPEIRDRLEVDLVKLHELVEEKELERLFAPLAGAVQTAGEHHSDLASSLNRGQFRADGAGLAGTLYRLFDQTAVAAAATAYADRPFNALRGLAIDLNNESSAPDEALLLVHALRAHTNVPIPQQVIAQLDEDERTLRRLSLQKQLATAARQKSLGRVIELATALDPLTDDPEERTSLSGLLNQAIKQRRSRYIKWAFYGGIALLVLWANLSQDNPAPSTAAPRASSTPSPAARTDAADAPAPLPDIAPQLEVKPSAGRNQVLSLAELRYCRFENERLKIISEIVGDHGGNDVVTKYNASVDDYNLRCPQNRYRESDGAVVDRQLASSRPALEAESRRRVFEWGTGDPPQ